MSDYYSQAFARNIGIISPEEQERLRQSCVAIPGMGGMGGVHLTTLARTGIGKFRIADFDKFEVVNTNRQCGATANHLGRNKVEVMAEVARDINPDVELTIFSEAITGDNIDEFLSGADVVIDGLDFFAPDARQMLFRKAREKGLYVVSSGPIGFSATLHVFSPTGMSFDSYFDFKNDMSYNEKLTAFAVGLAPGGTHLSYMNPKNIDFETGEGPSLGLACQIGSGMTATEVVNIILKRRPIKAAPHYFQFDPYTMKYKRGHLWWGNRNPIQKFKLWYVKRILLKGKQIREIPGDIKTMRANVNSI